MINVKILSRFLLNSFCSPTFPVPRYFRKPPPGVSEQTLAELRAYGACLALLRQRFQLEGLKEAKEGWELEALRVLKALRSFTIGVSELQATGLGNWS